MKFKVPPYYFLGISLSISLTPSDSLWLPPVNYLLAPIPLASYKEQSICEPVSYTHNRAHETLMNLV